MFAFSQFSESRFVQMSVQKKLPFNLTPKIYCQQLELGAKKTGIRFVSSNIPKVRGPFVVSLDRKIASKGYTKGNVQVVIGVNVIKLEYCKILLQVRIT